MNVNRYDENEKSGINRGPSSHRRIRYQRVFRNGAPRFDEFGVRLHRIFFSSNRKFQKTQNLSITKEIENRYILLIFPMSDFTKSKIKRV